MIFEFTDVQKMWKIKMKRKDFGFYQLLKNVENEGKTGRFQIFLLHKNDENEGQAGQFSILPMFK